MNAGTDGRAVVEGKELRISRVFDAPRAMVWKVWTQPEHVTNWWGPRGFTTTSKYMDVRTGGEWQLVMHGPDRDFHTTIVYDEVTPPKRLVYHHVPGAIEKPVSFKTTVNFEEEGGRTRVTMLQQFATVEEHQFVLKTYHSDEGASQTFARLGEYLTLQQARAGSLVSGETEREITLTRVLNAPREMVWAAWTEPQHLMAWCGPRQYTSPRCEIDLRPGGKMLMVMRGPDRVDLPLEGLILEVKAPERLVFTTAASGPDGRPLIEGHNTLTLVEKDGKTVMTLVARAKAMQPMAIAMLAGMEMGWSQSLEKMQEFVEGLVAVS